MAGHFVLHQIESSRAETECRDREAAFRVGNACSSPIHSADCESHRVSRHRILSITGEFDCPNRSHSPPRSRDELHGKPGHETTAGLCPYDVLRFGLSAVPLHAPHGVHPHIPSHSLCSNLSSARTRPVATEALALPGCAVSGVEDPFLLLPLVPVECAPCRLDSDVGRKRALRGIRRAEHLLCSSTPVRPVSVLLPLGGVFRGIFAVSVLLHGVLLQLPPRGVERAFPSAVELLSATVRGGEEREGDGGGVQRQEAS